MPMRMCERCGENRWSFETVDSYVRATCELCGYEVEFSTALHHNSPCPRCSTPLEYRKSKFTAKKLTKQYYYHGTLHCSKCNKSFLSDRYKVYPQQSPKTALTE